MENSLSYMSEFNRFRSFVYFLVSMCLGPDRQLEWDVQVIYMAVLDLDVYEIDSKIG